jgi:RNA-directed DNA polymerase
VLSPLLLNIALHGIEEAAGRFGNVREAPLLVRYGDDSVILHADLQVLQQAARRVQAWLAILGLRLNARKTPVLHTLSPFQGQAGFEFLGFTLRQYPAGPVQRKAASLPLSGRAFASPEPSPGWQTVITPGEEATKRHLAVVSQRIGQVQAAPQAPLIRELNPLIGGWAAYYRGLVEEAVLGRSDEQMEHQLFQWARLRHPGKSREWLLGRYWQPRDERERVFATPDGAELRTYRQASRPHQNGGKGHRDGT